MPREIIGRCPVCDDKLQVQRLYCPQCETAVEGRFDICKFCHLTKEQREFTEIFIKNRGNIKEVERELGISYPTVRGRLETVIRALGYRVEPEAEEGDHGKRRKELLDSLSRGELSAEEVLKRLKQLG
ncbi:MAG: DUF2089 domain-containing protein [Bacillota bacterium]